MTYQENYQKWVDFADLPDYLRQDLENMDEKAKEEKIRLETLAALQKLAEQKEGGNNP